MNEHVTIANADLLKGDAEWKDREDEQDERARAMAERWDDCRPDPKPVPRVKRSNMPRPDRLWRERVLERDQGCCVHPNPADCSEWFQAHHVVPQQVLRKSRPDVLWHTLVGMGVCGLAHRQHHSRVRPILYSEIPPLVLDFLGEIGFGPYLVRHYPACLPASSGATLPNVQL